MDERLVITGALLASLAGGYGVAERASLPAVEAPPPAEWSLPPAESPDLAAASERLAQTRAWKDTERASGDGSDGGGDANADAETTDDADTGRGWAFHGVVIDGGERTALITTAEGKVLRLSAGERLPGGSRLATIRADFIEVDSSDGERRFRLYRQR